MNKITIGLVSALFAMTASASESEKVASAEGLTTSALSTTEISQQIAKQYKPSEVQPDSKDTSHAKQNDMEAFFEEMTD